jgi:hypothetical protein
LEAAKNVERRSELMADGGCFKSRIACEIRDMPKGSNKRTVVMWSIFQKEVG